MYSNSLKYSPLFEEDRRGRPWKRYLLPASAVLILVAILAWAASSQDALGPVRNYLCSAEYNEEKIFFRSRRYQDLSPDADPAWEKLLTPNGGFYIHEEEGQEHKFGIGMFHQLHCLQKIRGKMQSLLSNATSDEGLHEHHVIHCFDYLRQSILCLADDTIENPVGEGKKEHVDGYTKHKCRSNLPLYKLSRDSGMGKGQVMYGGNPN